MQTVHDQRKDLIRTLFPQGVLRTETGTVVPAIHALLDGFTGGSIDPAALAARNICGFTVTPPKGSDLAQTLIQEELDAAARTGVPMALYQLPQITENEMSPETVESLVSRYPNIYLLKDTSGEDRVACARRDLSNLWLVRGAEGDYAKWPKPGGGPYDGFLLSTATALPNNSLQCLTISTRAATMRRKPFRIGFPGLSGRFLIPQPPCPSAIPLPMRTRPLITILPGGKSRRTAGAHDPQRQPTAGFAPRLCTRSAPRRRFRHRGRVHAFRAVKKSASAAHVLSALLPAVFLDTRDEK